MKYLLGDKFKVYPTCSENYRREFDRIFGKKKNSKSSSASSKARMKRSLESAELPVLSGNDIAGIKS